MNLNLLWSLIWAILKKSLVATVVAQVDALPTDTADVATAEKTLCANIQAQRRIPGEIRRFLCAEVTGITAANVDAWKALVIAKLGSL